VSTAIRHYTHKIDHAEWEGPQLLGVGSRIAEQGADQDVLGLLGQVTGPGPARRHTGNDPAARGATDTVPDRNNHDRSGGQVLEFDGLHKSFGDNRVLDGVGLTVAPGSMFGFCGSNGAGKTTTMRIAMGLVRPDAGEVRWQGRRLDQELRRRIGYMPEERGLYPKMKVGEQVAYFARLHGLDRGAAERAAGEWVERLGLGTRRGDAVEKLSLGNQQRVQLAAALVSRPEVLILDEPFSGLDPIGVDSLAEALLDQARAGVPVVFSSHQLDLVERLCDSVGILARGRMVATGTVEELRRREAGRLLRVVVPDAGPYWAADLPDVRIVSVQAGDTVLELDAGADDQAVLAAALRTGRVTHFAWQQPTLVELFREAVAAPTPQEVAA
jgi:ABC-2 type transport system ATP-binding protein